MTEVMASRGKGFYVSKKLGIEVNDSVTWQGWEPGGEYTKHITLKNVQIKTQKLKYRGPSTRFFTTLYPKPIVLSSGTSFNLPVTFRPLEKDQYEDQIEFETNNGIFSIPMKAVLPKPDVSIPESLNFGMCAVKDSIEVTFEVKNTSELMTSFHWELSEPFTLVPSSGTLAPKTACFIKATFTPKAALVYEAVALCKYSHEPENTESKSMKIEGIGKFPHLIASTMGRNRSTVSMNGHEVLVDFGEVPVQTTDEKWIELHNFSPVNAPFQILQPSSSSNIDTVFFCSQYHGIVAPNSTARIKVAFNPHIPNLQSTDTFEVVALGATNCSVIKCVGTGKGPSVSLDCPFLDFTVVESGKQIARTFKIANSSSVPAAFQFLIDCNQSVFRLNTACGLLSGGESITIIVHFTPTHPINYYRRLACLVQNQDPLFIDLFGTCQTEQVKPAPLQQKHLLRYHTHVRRGLSKMPPEQLNVMLQDGKLQIDENGALMPAEGTKLGESENVSITQLTAMEELFNDGSFGETALVEPHVSLDIQHLSFGKVLEAGTVEQKTVNITNHTKGKITCQWMRDKKGIFSVSPDNSDILPLRTASFRVTFRPNASNQFFSAELECYCFYKSLRDYRLVEDNSFCPPWCLTLDTSGQTFSIGAETFIPRYNLDVRNMVLPAITPEQMSYRTLLLTNTGTNHINFDFEQDPDRIFSCRPSRGLLTDKYQVVVFRMVPPEAKVFKHTMKCCLNEADKYTQEINLLGSAETPQVQLGGEGTIYFKPTCIGTSSTRSLSVKNTSRIPLRFRWNVSGKDVKVLAIEPQTGMIGPNETQSHSFTFTPSDESKYLVKPKLFISSSLELFNVIGLAVPLHWRDRVRVIVFMPSDSGYLIGWRVNSRAMTDDEVRYLVRVIGEGSLGKIICVEPNVDFGDIIVGGSSSKDITIHNNSDCSLHYDFLVDQEIRGPYDDEETARDVLAIELSESSGVIPATTSKRFTATVFPARRVTYKFLLSYVLLSTTDDGENHHITRNKTMLAELHCQGVYPTLSISDVRGLGSNKGYSKVKLWNLFSLDSLNECLDSDPSPPELMYAAATRHSTKRRVPVYTRAVMDFNFGASPNASDPAIIHLNLQNTGSVPADWSFLYPSDLQLELEYWAENGEYDADELHEMQVMDKKLFTVEPKKGSLSPGESQTLTLTYRHLFTGTNKLPVIFKISKGREILLNFIGVTVDPDAYYVHFASTKHLFEPVPVGGNTPPVQIYELHNAGSMPVNYEFDLEPLDQLEAQNYGCRILDCLNPSGDIPPGCTALIHWVFAPLEAKTYVVDIPIRIIGGEAVLVTFTGVGYDQRIMGDTMVFSEGVSTGVPSKQIVPVQHQLATLSIERLSFGNFPLYTLCRRVFFIANSSSEHVISFRWNIEGSPAERVLMIEPDHGYLHPGQSTLLKMSFFSSGPPSMYDLDVLCEVVDETEMAEFNQRLIDWTNKQEEKQYTFTITEEENNREKGAKTRPRSGQRLRSIDNTSQAISKSEGDLRKYNALPPIGSAGKRDERYSSKRKARKSREEEQQTPLQPSPPESFWLHLGVTARTHSLAEFYKNFQSDINNFFIDQRYVMNKDTNTDKQDLSALVTCSRPEMGVVTDLLSVILRGLLYDESFHNSLKELSNEPVPYFRQLCETPFTLDEPTSRPSSPGSSDKDVATKPKEETPLSRKNTQALLISTSYELDDRAITKTHEIIQRSGSAFSVVEYLKDQHLDPEWKSSQRQKARSFPECQSLIEAVLENTLHNIATEASRAEVNLCARPRVIALPPSRLQQRTRTPK